MQRGFFLEPYDISFLASYFRYSFPFQISYVFFSIERTPTITVLIIINKWKF